MEQTLINNTREGGKLTRKAAALRALIIFFAAMMALTLIARAADALTLPQVRTATLTSGKLTHVVRTEGVLEAASELPVKADAGLTVERVHVVEGQAVREGETLLSYDQAALMEEIEKVKTELMRLDLKKREQTLGGSAVDPSDPSYKVNVQRAEENILIAQEEAQLAIARAEEDLSLSQGALIKAQENLAYVERTTEDERRKKAEGDVNSARRAYDSASSDSSSSVDAARLALEAALKGDKNGVVDESEVAAARQSLAAAESSGQFDVADASAALREAQDDLQKMIDTPLSQEAAVKAAQAQVEAARADVLAMERALEDARLGLDSALRDAWRDLTDAEISEKKARQERAKSQQETEEAEERKALQLQGIDLDIDVQQKELKRLEGILASGAALTAPQDGTVLEIHAKAGEKAQGAALHLALAGDGCYVHAKITGDQAKLLSAGADVLYKLSGESSFKRGGVVKSLRPVEDGFEVLATLPDGVPGQSASLRIERSTEPYEQVVPIGALVKMSGERDGVLVVRQRQGVLGEEDYVELMAVEVLDKDGSLAALSANLNRSDMILESSNKPVSENDRVRRINP